MEAAVSIYADVCGVLDGDLVVLGYVANTIECKGSYGRILLKIVL